MAQIGVQAMMLRREIAEEGVFTTLQKVNEIGFHAVEISQIPMTAENVSELERAHGELGMSIAALSAVLTGAPGGANYSLDESLDRLVADARLLDTSMVRIGMLPVWALASRQAVIEFCDQTNAAASRLRDEGIALYYHNHHIDFSKYDGRYLLDIIADRAPLMGLEVDVHWVQRGGLDPVTVLKKYGERVAMVHLKDYRIGHITPAAVSAHEAGDHQAFAAVFDQLVEFAEVGEGNLDFTAIIDTSIAIGAKYLLVEQDDTYGRPVFESLKISHDNLVDLGYEKLFAVDSKKSADAGSK